MVDHNVVYSIVVGVLAAILGYYLLHIIHS